MKRGYTLIELMVALFIMALLVAVGVPIYTSEINKSEIASAMVTLGELEQAAKVAYEENNTNTNITYAGTTLNNNVVTAINAGPAINALYIYPGGNSNVSSTQFLVCVYVGNLNFSGYVAPTAGNAGSYSRLCKQVTVNDPIYTSVCGALQGNSSDIPTNLLPPTCSCPNIWAGTC